MRYYIGTSGWNYKHWKGKFYPEKIPQRMWLDHIMDNFDTVEVNASFYRWPKKETMGKWKERAKKRFKFTMKAPQSITHRKRFKDVQGMVDDFYKLTSILGNNLGCHLFQCPPSFHADNGNISRMESFCECLDARKRNVIEFRHKSWWDEGIYDMLRKNKVSFCIVDGLGMPKDLVKTNKTVYMRLHGARYNTRYSRQQLKTRSDKLSKLDSDDVYIYFNNDYNAYAPANAQQLKEVLR